MDINFVQRDKSSWVLEIEEEGHTLFNMLKRKLQDDKTVKFAGYNQPHPLINKFILTVKGSNVKLSITKALKGLKEEITALEKQVK
jgi:DNA-directed RNA polymerase subunit L